MDLIDPEGLRGSNDARLKTLVVDHVLTPSGWLSPGAITIDPSGTITQVAPYHDACAAGEEEVDPNALGRPLLRDESRFERLRGFAVPGLPNLHSHAFQRALSGLTENGIPGGSDSFWTWRTRMYALAEILTPDDVEAIAAQLYVEMLERGMTTVGEFHYLHHDRKGARFGVPHEMSLAILRAQASSSIALTHLPVLYLSGGFGAPPLPRQARFVCRDVEEFLALYAALAVEIRDRADVLLGIAPHSLRAVGLDALEDVVRGVGAIDSEAPVHIHIAEQMKEVEECIEYLGARPVNALFDRVEIDRRYTLVHATHVDDGERARLAESGAVAGLCPTTEANLGDGLFPARAYLEAGGRFGVGSDSHVSVSATEELRLLEYGQRLVHQRRNVLLCGDGGRADRSVSVGEGLYVQAARGGAQALGRLAGALVAGRRADIVVLDPEHPRLTGHGPSTILDAFIFGGADGAVDRVIVGGRTVVKTGAHIRRQSIFMRFREVMKRLAAHSTTLL